MNNRELKEQFKNYICGDSEAFVKIYNSIKIPVYTVAYRIVQNRQSAQDITQDLFLKLFTSPIDDTIRNPRAWIFQVTRNLALDVLRKKRSVEFEEGAHSSNYTFETRTAMRMDLENAIALLGQAEREILSLHLNADLTFNEISKILEISSSAVYRKYKKAIKNLRDLLNGGSL